MRLRVEGVEGGYGKAQVLFGVSLEVGEGEMVALLGANGAGKTTTLKAVMGLLPRRRGRILVFGRETVHEPPHRLALLGVGYVPEGRRVFPYLTVEENLRLVQGKRPGPFSLERVYEIFPRLWERRRHLGRQLSGGEQEMLAIGRALLLNPRLLLLDEPSQGLAPLVVRLVAEVLRRLKKEGVSLLLAEQNAHLALDLADRVYVLDDGRVAYEGEARALREDPERVRALTGVRRR
ncbi:ABC transporter ATP-binding protein [Thermus scotoductus]|uniref:ABC transporter ATP-binding protein n=1 Tax=Thermus scotoductus TaxID=37636 RepID=A0A430V1B8_THESC|nr:ABC transporter ATP-binding protein [Thermus scotoductus]RTI16206.1 ABC transporter ATP-binding protein [Thermus scotoductus]